MLPFPMGVVIELGVGSRIVYVALGIVVELIEGALLAKDLGDHVGVALL